MPRSAARILVAFGGELPGGAHTWIGLGFVAEVPDAMLVGGARRAGLARLTRLRIRDARAETALTIAGVVADVPLRAADALPGAPRAVVASARGALPIARARFPEGSRRANTRCGVGHGRALARLAIRAAGTRRACRTRRA